MAKPKNKHNHPPVTDYRHKAKRKHIPPAGLAAQGEIKEAPKLQFAYDPHRPPLLRFDSDAAVEKVIAKLERGEKLTASERAALAAALRNHEPWLEWAGKREKKGFEVEPVALHIHERISAQAILKVAARQDAQRDLFADPRLSYQQAVQFYEHDVDWANRMILGDSLQVMASLARREGLAGKVQMIYLDPPYGIKFASNFQPEIGRRDVKDKETDLTREPEMVKAYRDTWTLGVHSYLAYLRDRLILCRELLADTGSIFVQIGDENLHRVRAVMDEVFGVENCFAIVAFKKTLPLGSSGLAGICDFLLWYCRNAKSAKYHELFESKPIGAATGYTWLELANGLRRKMTPEERTDPSLLEDYKPFFASALASSGYTPTCMFDFVFEGRVFKCGAKSWRTNRIGIDRVTKAERLIAPGQLPCFIAYHDDFPVQPLHNLWDDTHGATDLMYVVQTSRKVIERCLLMTTDPGDLVLDPSCGSGTTAYVAEQWGRRWITIDTSRVALALARQRLLTARFDYYKLKDEARGVAGGFVCKTVPHITLRSIAQNVALDAIFAKHQPVLEEKLKALNDALRLVTPELRQRLRAKLLEKEKREGKKAVTDADRRRWLLPPQNRAKDAYTTVPNDFAGWYEWEVPFDTDPDWPAPLQEALRAYRAAWRAKMDEVNACIAANAEQEELVDKPEIVRGIVRVSGPFTMEAVMPAEESLGEETPIGGAPAEELETFGSPRRESGEDGRRGDEAESSRRRKEAEGSPRGDEAELASEPVNAEAYLDKMLRLLKADGVRFPNNKVAKFSRLEALSGAEFLHAEGEWTAENGKERRVAVSFGPQFGPVTAYQVENALRQAHRRGYDDLVFAGFSFDAAAQAAIQEDPNPKVRCHLAHIRPDVNMGDLLKTTPGSQIFTVFGTPRTKLIGPDRDGMYRVEMEGGGHLRPGQQRVVADQRGQGGGLVFGQRLRRADVLHHAGVFPRQKRVGQAGAGVERRGGRGGVCGVGRDGVAAVRPRPASARGRQGHRPARQRSAAGAPAGREGAVLNSSAGPQRVGFGQGYDARTIVGTHLD